MFETLAVAYIVGVLVVMGFVLVAMQVEPTDHGQIMLFQVGAGIAALWPISVPYFLIVLTVLGTYRLYMLATGGKVDE